MRAEEAVLFLVVAMLSLALVAAVVTPLLRQKRSGHREAPRVTRDAASAGPDGPTCPTCHRQLSAGYRFCPFDGTSLAPPPVVDVIADDGGPASRGRNLAANARKICPTCARGYRGEASVCERDGAPLVPIN
jgi:hypothetical protein